MLVVSRIAVIQFVPSIDTSIANVAAVHAAGATKPITERSLQSMAFDTFDPLGIVAVTTLLVSAMMHPLIA